MNIKKNTFFRQIWYLLKGCQERHSYKHGCRNRIINNGAVRVGNRIQILGDRNVITLEEGCVLKNTLIKICGNDNNVIIKQNAFVSGAELWIENNGCTITIGDSSFVGHHSHLACTEDGRQLLIGRDCLVSSYVQIRTGDSHSILDIEGNRINPAQSVTIGNHVWIGEGATILKGVELQDHTIVGTGAIVTKPFYMGNVLLGGVPAKVIKENVLWDSERR